MSRRRNRPASARMPDPESLLPLRPTVFAILAVLHAGKLHGYGIMKRLNESGGMLGPGTLYRTLKEMRDLGLVAHTEAPEGEEAGDERRSYYALTSFGRDVAQAEAERLAGLMKEARLGGVR